MEDVSLPSVLSYCPSGRAVPKSQDSLRVASGYRGDGTGYNIYLTLKADGKYTAECQGCLSKYGEASGQWTLNGKLIVFKPSKEKDMMKGALKGPRCFEVQGRVDICSC
jgi:hypothetical protein